MTGVAAAHSELRRAVAPGAAWAGLRDHDRIHGVHVLTSACIVRQGLPSFDGATNSYVRDWVTLRLPWLLLAMNTVVLLISSVTMEFARRQGGAQAALAPVKSIPGVSLGEEKAFPWLGITVLFGIGFLAGQWLAVASCMLADFFVDTNPR